MTTPNLGMTKPTVGADTDSWGGELNTNLDLIDARLPKVAFSAYLNNSTQSIPNATLTKIMLNAEEFDVGGYFDSTNNYRFTPQVAGYYHFDARVNFDSLTAAGAVTLLFLNKNGSIYKRGTFLSDPAGSGAAPATCCPTVSALIFLNGSTDYVELYAFQENNSSLNLTNGNDNSENYMTGFLAFPA